MDRGFYSEEKINALFKDHVKLLIAGKMGLSFIKKQMQMSTMFKTYTLQGALDKLDVIQCFEVPGQKFRVGEILEKQKEIYRCLGLEPPASL